MYMRKAQASSSSNVLAQTDIQSDIERASAFERLLQIRSYIVLYLLRIVRKTYNIRRPYKDIQFWAAFVNCGEKLADSRHPDYGLKRYGGSTGGPSCFLMDLSLVDGAFLILVEPQIAKAIVFPSKHYEYSASKKRHACRPLTTYWLGIAHYTRKRRMETLRKRFNPSFEPKHIYSLAPL